ncbi:MAG TPA: S-adenosylmethionine:tRNA ribosyltransferase-isomerase [Labilithrix sp.]|nr:S-adenosylmethionine:tRNA ribosyltransferase-isomerase [Labilithrix sp.]
MIARPKEAALEKIREDVRGVGEGRTTLEAASAARHPKNVRVLVVDGPSAAMRVVPSKDVASLFFSGDLLVVNDAATLPASLTARTSRGEEIELRLASMTGERRWIVALFGSGSFRTRTEDRPAPPRIGRGEALVLGEDLVARVIDFLPESSRLLTVELSLAHRPHASMAELWSALYRAGQPVQYAHVPEPFALWDVQNVYASRPWAVEMPSAGRALQIETLLELRQRGVEIARVTHAAGLSSIGDAGLDALLPLPERFEVSEETWTAVARSRARGGRVVAIGTSVVRALEGSARAGKLAGVTDFRIGPATRRAVVDAVLTGLHDIDTSHFALLGAFASVPLMTDAIEVAKAHGLLGHEMGDACLVWAEPRKASRFVG